ncbi:DUF1553 domain-containing protein [Symmachiella dynata]|uniref:DUF1553 domain-containing protein n=1 Tax=Symmachiella dynata TaxID=2527995 RepID=UPI0030EF8F86
MTRLSFWIHAVLAAPLVLFGFSPLLLAADDPGDANAQNEFFQQKVEPILVGRCLECHGSEHKGELDLRSKATALKGGESGSVIEPGDVDSSLLYDYVVNEEMPPKKPLSDDEMAVLKQWIETGAYFPSEPLNQFATSTDTRAGYDWWSLRPLAEVSPPKPDGIPAAWNENPIDRFVFAKLVEKQLQPSAPAQRRQLLRRITYDLIGLPPTPEEVDDFVNDDSPDAYERVVDRLLASPHYGEQWGRHWLDVIRFGESRGFERNEIINNAWPFRDYVIRSFNEDKPFDQMVLEHLAGDVIGAGDPDVEIATTFLVSGPYDDVGNQDAAQAAQIRANTIDEIIRATSEAFLGLTVGCSRCHNHKFDPVTQDDYYSLYATFAGVHHGVRVIATAEQKQQHAAALQPLQETQKQLEKQRGELENEINKRGEEKAADFESAWTREPVRRTGAEETFPPISAKFIRLTVEGVDNNPQARTGYRIEEFEAWTAGPDSHNVAAAKNGGKATGRSRTAKDFDAYNAMQTIDGRFGARWIATGPELTIEFAEPQTIERVLFSSDRAGQAGSQTIATFVCEYRLSVSLDGETWTEVASTADRKPVSAAHRRKRLMDAVITAAEKKQLADLGRQLAEVRQQQSKIAPLPAWWAGTFSAANGPFHVFLGGSPQRPGRTVVPASLSTLSKVAPEYQLSNDSPEGERRLSLAKWLIADDNPLPARVLANRLWHYHFGTGIVATPSDFGFMGVPPTHPQLLDWLARQLQKNGWRLKPLHKQIVMSQAYRQSSAYREDFAKVDADSRYLWRFPPRRLTAEEIRDAMLMAGGKLDRRAGGPGFRLYRYLQDNVATYVPLDDFGPETYRRSVYHQNARASRIDLMTDFDSPDCAFATPRRSSTTSPLQALTLMNHKFTLDMATALADRIGSELSDASSPAAQVGRAFELCFCRAPSDDETTACSALVKQHGLPALCRVLLNSNEFIYLN